VVEDHSSGPILQKNYRWKLKLKSASSILQALSFGFCRLKSSNSSKLEVSKKWNQGSLYLYTMSLMPRAFFRWVVASKARALGAAENTPDHVGKNPGGDFWTTWNINKSWKLGTHKQVDCNRKISRLLKLAELSFQIWAEGCDAGSRTNFRTTFHTLNRGISFQRLLDLQILLRS